MARVAQSPDTNITVLATGNVKMKHICFRCKCICFSRANKGVVFSHLTTQFRNQKKVTVSVFIDTCSVY